MGRVSEQVESLRIEITSNQNARTLSPRSSSQDREYRLSLDTHTHTTLQIYPNHPSQDKLYQSVAVNPNLCIANGSSVWVLR